MEVKDMSRIQEKFVRRTAQAGPDYDAGVSNPKRDWATATKAAESSYEQGVTAAMSKKRLAGVWRLPGPRSTSTGRRSRAWPAMVRASRPGRTTTRLGSSRSDRRWRL